MADPARIVSVLRSIGVAASALYDAIDNASNASKLEHNERQPLNDLRKAVENLRSDILVYKVLMNAMESDTDPSGRPPYTRFIQRYGMRLRSFFIYNQLLTTPQKERTGSDGKP